MALVVSAEQGGHGGLPPYRYPLLFCPSPCSGFPMQRGWRCRLRLDESEQRAVALRPAARQRRLRSSRQPWRPAPSPPPRHRPRSRARRRRARAGRPARRRDSACRVDPWSGTRSPRDLRLTAPRSRHRPRVRASRSISLDICAALLGRVRRDHQHLLQALGAVGMLHQFGIHTVSRGLVLAGEDAHAARRFRRRPLKGPELCGGCPCRRGMRDRPLEIGGANGRIAARAEFLPRPAAESTAVKAIRSMPSPFFSR